MQRDCKKNCVQELVKGKRFILSEWGETRVQELVIHTFLFLCIYILLFLASISTNVMFVQSTHEHDKHWTQRLSTT